VLALAVLLALSPVPQDSRQLVLAVAPTWGASHGYVTLYERRKPDAPWRRKGSLMPVSFGRAGLAWGRGLHPSSLEGPVKREGDGRSPAGVFHIPGLSGYPAAPPAGTRLPYRQATTNLRCVDDPNSAFYNRWVEEGEVAKDWTSAEDMRRRDELYRYAIWVSHNDAPPQPGAGSCIFLHLRASPAATTAGCTAFDEGPLRRLVRWLDPRAQPVLVQLPKAVLGQVARSWGLPVIP